MKTRLAQILIRIILTAATLLIMLGACLAIVFLYAYKWTRRLAMLLTPGRTTAVVAPAVAGRSSITRDMS